MVNAAFNLHTLVRDQSGSQILSHQPPSIHTATFVWVEAGWMEREGWGEEVLPAKIVSISTSDGWCKELLLSARTMVPARDSRVHYPEISDPLNPDSRTQRNERVLTEKSRKRLCFLANTQGLSLRSLSLYFLLSRFELEISETDTRLAGFSGFWHFWLFQIVFHQTQFFFLAFAFSDFHISLMSEWTMCDCGRFVCLSEAHSYSSSHCGVSTHSTFTLMIMAPFSPNVKYHILFCFMCLKQFCNKNVL